MIGFKTKTPSKPKAQINSSSADVRPETQTLGGGAQPLGADAQPLGTNAQPLAGGDESLGVPIYYEAWGGLESANKTLWTALWFAISAAILLIILLRLEIQKPPVVILLSQTGSPQVVVGAQSAPPVSADEIKNFIALFERFFTELDRYAYNESLQTAFSMMTPKFKIKAQDILDREGLIETIKTDEIRTKLTLTDISIVRETPEFIECDVKGWREISSFKLDGPKSEIVFEDEIILKKVPRSQTAPDGVLVKDWKESLFKK